MRDPLIKKINAQHLFVKIKCPTLYSQQLDACQNVCLVGKPVFLVHGARHFADSQILQVRGKWGSGRQPSVSSYLFPVLPADYEMGVYVLEECLQIEITKNIYTNPLFTFLK